MLHSLKTEGHWHSTVWREFVLPHLPKYLQSKWFAKWHRRSNPLPPWITPTYAQTLQTQAATQQYYESSLSSDQMHVVNWGIDSAGSVGMSQVYKLIRSAHQLQHTSPLLDRRLVEFVLGLHPSLQNDSIHEKIFLRQANRTNFPNDVLWRPKDNYFDPLKYAGIGKGQEVLELFKQIESFPLLQTIIDVKLLEILLNRYRQGYSESYCPGEPYQNSLANQLYHLFAFINWYQRVLALYIR
jgi:asparagine synthase (glutamine-hydrolysing)